MISAWDIYWVMQLDNISLGLFFLWVGLAALMGIRKINAAVEMNEQFSNAKYMPFFVLAFLGCLLLPSSKTAAAMIVIPAIVNNKEVQEEASEIYQLAKQGLASIVETQPKQETQE